MSTNNTQDNSNEKVINKPISVARDDLIGDFAKAVNESGLPIYMIEYIIRDFLNEVSRVAAQQAEKEKQQYQINLEKAEE